MEIYILDGSFSRLYVLDAYISFLWNEKYNDLGDLEITVKPTDRNRKQLLIGRYISHTESKKLMVIEERYTTTDSSGSEIMNIKGRSIDSFLTNRVVPPNEYGLNWIAKGTPGSVARNLVSKICVQGEGLSLYDTIPELSTVDLSGSGTSTDHALPPQSLYTAVKTLCDSVDLGFTTELHSTTPRLRFKIYKGIVRKNIMFSSILDNLTEETLLESHTGYKNVAYVWGKEPSDLQVVIRPGVSPGVTGLYRKVMHVDASDIDDTNLTEEVYKSQLRQRGLEGLGKNQKQLIVDGVLTSVNTYFYGIHYQLGDTVKLVNIDGVHTSTMVTEYIWAIDGEGLRSYPTFKSID